MVIMEPSAVYDNLLGYVEHRVSNHLVFSGFSAFSTTVVLLSGNTLGFIIIHVHLSRGMDNLVLRTIYSEQGRLFDLINRYFIVLHDVPFGMTLAALQSRDPYTRTVPLWPRRFSSC